MRIVIETIPHSQQRYDTVGDWQWTEAGDLHIKVSDEVGGTTRASLIAIHELVEALLCRWRNIPQDEVDAFDMTFTGEGEPGDYIAAPYYKEHQFATIVERMICHELGIQWQLYNLAIEEVSNGHEAPKA